MMLLKDRVVIVTGGGRGLGRAHCLELARHGALVVVNDIGAGVHGEAEEASPGDEVVAEITGAGGTAIADGTSVTDFEGMAKLVERTVQDFGHLDAVVNNAGIVRDRILTNMTEDDFDLVVAVHLKGTFNLSRHVCAHWKERAKAGEHVTGRIVNTTSGAGLFGNPGQANYAPAKAAIASLTLVTAMEMQRYGVTANAVSPLAATRMTANVASLQAGKEGDWNRYDPANTSPVVAWLCSEESGWLSGAVLRIDGDKVQRLHPWDIDESRTYHGTPGQAVDAESLDAAMRATYAVLPNGTPTTR